MRVELIYAPDCRSFKTALCSLETIIAEERLPISVELTESITKTNGPSIKIDGRDVADLLPKEKRECCHTYQQHHGIKGALCVEHLRSVLWRKWKELTWSAPFL